MFPADIKNSMKTCLLNIFWAKKDIIKFFKDNGCTQKDLTILNDPSLMNRSSIIDILFQLLDEKADNGLGQYRSILQSLLSWNTFDPYYFDKLKKLNRADAERALDHLRQIQELRDAKIKEERTRKKEADDKAQKAVMTKEELKKHFYELFKSDVNVQKRGYQFEKILLELARIDSLEVTEGFRVVGEQIDGAFKFEGEHYLFEAKWQDKESSNEPVYQMVGKIEGKMYGRGFFISINGFSDYVVQSLVKGKAIKTILADGGDITQVIEGYISFKEMIDKKVKAAQTKGHIYIDALTEKSKANEG
jgi:hypothetical protein